ncbi:MAG: DNA methyltransferase [Candidatus Hodarchaeota archaeon]
MESRIIEITPAAHKYGNLNLSSCGRDFFPPDIYGGHNKESGLGKPITIIAHGLPEPIKTDIPKNGRTGKPRWLFRERTWVKKFVRIHNLKKTDRISINRITSKKYSVFSEKPPSDLVKLDEAARLVGKTTYNIRDYIQRGRIKKYNEFGVRLSKAQNGELRVSLKELKDFLCTVANDKRRHHTEGLHEELGFYGIPEYERTKHVHRLHSYLGKFIPQLVEWFLARYFKENDIVLDPFVGSGTTLVQGNELKMHTVGIDISEFNCLITKVKTQKYDIEKAKKEI